jgi:hypothetical protein
MYKVNDKTYGKTDSELLNLTITDFMEPLHIPTVNDFLYVQMAARIEKQVKQNLLKPGDKLPSVRALSQEQGISVSTAFKAYTELESNGDN